MIRPVDCSLEAGVAMDVDKVSFSILVASSWPLFTDVYSSPTHCLACPPQPSQPHSTNGDIRHPRCHALANEIARSPSSLVPCVLM
jgi:hypothetical protein